MRLPRMRFTVRWMMVAVAIAGWISFNAMLIARICFSSEDRIRPAPFVGPVRIVTFAALAWTVGTIVWCIFVWFLWRQTSTSHWALLRGGIAGGGAGFFAWFAALILLFIGYGVDGQAPLSAIILGVQGAALNAIPGSLIACAWAWRKRRL